MCVCVAGRSECGRIRLPPAGATTVQRGTSNTHTRTHTHTHTGAHTRTQAPRRHRLVQQRRASPAAALLLYARWWSRRWRWWWWSQQTQQCRVRNGARHPAAHHPRVGGVLRAPRACACHCNAVHKGAAWEHCPTRHKQLAN